MIHDLPNIVLQQSLENIAKSLPNFISRPTQQQMIAAVFNALSCTRFTQPNSDKPAEPTDDLPALGESILVVEGPTGTGKSLGYLLPAIIAAKQHKKYLVVSSATVMLQEQLANKDIPFIAKHAGLPVSYAIAKGRGRYVCPQKLYQQVTQASQVDFLASLLEEEKKPSDREVKILKKIASRLSENRWSGDKDALDEDVPDAVWSRVTNDRHGCLKRECTYFRECPFYAARDKLAKADIIVANHDLLLSDLAMGGGILLPPPEKTFYCIDEAHHLPNKATQQFAAEHAVYSSATWLEKLHSSLGKVAVLLEEHAIAERAQQATHTIREQLQALGYALAGLFEKNSDILVYRCQHGVLPEGFDLFSKQLLPAIQTLLQALKTLQDQLKRHKAKQVGKAHEASLEKTMTELGFFVGRAQNLQAVWKLLNMDVASNEPPIAKWITATTLQGKVDYILSVSPVRAARLLSERLWQRAAGAVLTSATLRSMGTFEKLLVETGLNYFPKTTCLALPSPFNLKQQGQLALPAMKTDPKNPDAHTEEIIQLMPDLIQLNKNEGTLVLFSSKKQMLAVAEALPFAWRNILLVQGAETKEALLRSHFDRISNNQASVLFGLASFAEGLDLPGKACTHVIIAKLPFSMPDDPVSQTLADWIELRGGNPFFEVSLPEASIRLTQAMGRLIRSETDRGVITILDTRLTTKPYGRLLKQSLPAFGGVS